MSKLGEIITQDNGEEFILTPKGWIPNSVELESAASMGALGGLAQGFAEVAGLGMLPESSQSQAMHTMNPLSTKAGQAAEYATMATGVGGLALGLAKRGAKRGAASMADRVSDKIVDNERQLIRRPSDLMGGGNSALGQYARRIEAGTDAIPLVNMPGLIRQNVNARRVNMSGARALGVSEEMVEKARFGLKSEVLASRYNKFKDDFKAVEDQIKAVDPANFLPIMDEAIERGLVGGRLKAALQSDKDMGKSVMALRSRMTDITNSSAEFMVKDAAHEITEQIDDLIGTLSSVDQEAYSTLRSQYRLWASMRQGKSINADGNINPASLSSRLQRSFGDRFKVGERIEGVNDDINDFLQIVREGEQQGVGVGNSGTATREALLLLGGGAGGVGLGLGGD